MVQRGDRRGGSWEKRDVSGCKVKYTEASQNTKSVWRTSHILSKPDMPQRESGRRPVSHNLSTHLNVKRHTI